MFFRLNVIPIHIPPLRDRKADIIPLAELFLRKYAQGNGSTAKTFSEASIQYLLDNEWKGNVRELENTIERVVVLSSMKRTCPLNSSLSPNSTVSFSYDFQSEPL
ncbi:MAG: hypothetical protein IPJ71_00985 [Bdellovibrionales bacterium]|nr:hypothetical protein [Bdellovibrionales bacterium]